MDRLASMQKEADQDIIKSDFTGWQAFGACTGILLERGGRAIYVPGHNGETVPGFIIEDLIPFLQEFYQTGRTTMPFAIEIDPTWLCNSKNRCSGHCFSAEYRKNKPYSINMESVQDLIRQYGKQGGKVIRWDGGGEPLLHPDLRNGNFIEEAGKFSIKQTILSTGDMLHAANIDAFIQNNVYLRVSLNAIMPETYKIFHDNGKEPRDIIKQCERYMQAKVISKSGSETPTGMTFLISDKNYQEMAACARIARELGIAHFSVRRVLGPARLRPDYNRIDLRLLEEQFAQTRELADESFQVFIPWRPVDEPDLSASCIPARQCWQSRFKLFLEPDQEGGINANLCGTYRGGGVGQLQQKVLTPYLKNGTGDLKHFWKHWLGQYDRRDVIKTCKRCIDRGFILLVDRILNAFTILGGTDCSASYAIKKTRG